MKYWILFLLSLATWTAYGLAAVTVQTQNHRAEESLDHVRQLKSADEHFLGRKSIVVCVEQNMTTGVSREVPCR